MALNSYATPEGLEIGRAQAVQPEAAGVPCHTDMNPLLLKPTTDKVCQVVLNGKPVGNQHAYEYFRVEGREQLRKEVNDAFDRLAQRYNCLLYTSKDENEKVLRQEFRASSFSRSFAIPENVDAESIEASQKDGVLQITLPKLNKALEDKVKKIEIK